MANILVVEDDKMTQDFIKEVLEEHGHTVFVAYDSQECFRQLAAHPDTQLILLDIMLPGKSGWDIYDELKKKYPQIKVVIESAVVLTDDKREALKKENISFFLAKPFTQEKLGEVVKDVLAGA